MARLALLFVAVVTAGCGGQTPGAPDGGTSDADAGTLGDGGTGEVYSSSFDGDSATWPAPWVAAGGVDRADVVSGRARLAPTVSFYSLARMYLPGDEVDADVRFVVELDDLATQGVGFYVRQNGGYLEQSEPHGEGYAVFVEGFRAAPAIGIWREVDGSEQELQVAQNPVADMRSGVSYSVRFVAIQQDATTTRLRAKIWEASAAEPATWALDLTDTTPALQDRAGGFAADAWSSINPNTPGSPPVADIHIDDVYIVRPAP